MTNTSFLSCLRRARWVHLVQILVFTSWLANPFPGAFSYWTSSSGVKTEVADYPEGDPWYNSDPDNDGLTSLQEAEFGSDPYSIDSDVDGLADAVEYQLSQAAFTAGEALPFDPWAWDTNANGYSDFDEFYQQIQNYTPVVYYPNLQPGSFYSYADADGDGLKNFEDSDPLNMDRDSDTILNWNEAAGQMDDPTNGYTEPPPTEDPGVWIGGNWYPSGTVDSDGDGIPDQYDPFPYGSFEYQGIVYGGQWSDRDNDSIPDPADPFPDGSYYYNNVEYGGTFVDQDGDGIPDSFDTWPTVAGSYWYTNWSTNTTVEYPGVWCDQDGDGVPDPADATPNGSYWWMGTEYAGPWVDQDGDGTPDSFDPTPTGEPSTGGGDPDSDGDGTPDSQDPYPNDAWNGQPHYTYNGTEYSGYYVDSNSDGTPDPFDPTPNGDPDSDGDGIPDSQDSYPYDNWNGAPHYNYNGTEYPGYYVDSDSDGVPDPVDSSPFGDDSDGDGIPNSQDSYPYDAWNGQPHYNYNGTEYAGTWSDTDTDGIPDALDATPYGGYWYGNTEYAGVWTDTDGDSIPDPADPTPNGGYWYLGTEYSGPWIDSDSDGIPDSHDGYPNDRWNGAPHFTWQGLEYPGNITDDRDGDGIPDEADAAPDDRNNGMDSDDDGLGDFDENTEYHTDPNLKDTDDDGLSDKEELFTYHTNPLLKKTDPNQLYDDYYMVDQTDGDGDGIPDRIEEWYADAGWSGMSPFDPADAAGDLDGDGYTNLQAYHNGWSLTAHIGALDEDHDGIIDALEDWWCAFYPGILSNNNPDDAVQDFDLDGLMNFEEVALGLNPGIAFSRSTSVNDVLEWAWRGLLLGNEHGLSHYGLSCPEGVLQEWQVMEDADHDGVADGLQAFAAAYNADPELDLVTLPQRAASGDYDNDGMPDTWEHHYGLDLRDPWDGGNNPDGDSLSNTEEYAQNRNPLVNDDPPPVQIDTTSLSDGVVNASYTATIHASKGMAPYVFSLSEGTLPEGLELDSTTGSITGTTTTEGTASFSITVTDDNGQGQSVAQPYSVTVYPEGTILVNGHLMPPLAITTASYQMNAVTGVPFSVTLAATGGASANYTFALSNMGTLPPGLVVATDGKTIHGTPTTTGTCSFTATVTEGPRSTSQNFLLSVSAPMAFTTAAALPETVRPQAYSKLLQVSGGLGQKTFGRSGGTLPPRHFPGTFWLAQRHPHCQRHLYLHRRRR